MKRTFLNLFCRVFVKDGFTAAEDGERGLFDLGSDEYQALHHIWKKMSYCGENRSGSFYDGTKDRFPGMMLDVYESGAAIYHDDKDRKTNQVLKSVTFQHAIKLKKDRADFLQKTLVRYMRRFKELVLESTQYGIERTHGRGPTVVPFWDLVDRVQILVSFDNPDNGLVRKKKVIDTITKGE